MAAKSTQAVGAATRCAVTPRRGLPGIFIVMADPPPIERGVTIASVSCVPIIRMPLFQLVTQLQPPPAIPVCEYFRQPVRQACPHLYRDARWRDAGACRARQAWGGDRDRSE